MSGSIFEAYQSGAAHSFFGGHYSSSNDRARAVRRARQTMSADVVEAIAVQNSCYSSSPARDANLEALEKGAAAVVTGQQVGLFLGPLYTIYKAASALRVAKALAEESGRPVVPVFWLQTEDHDLAEIASCHVPCARGEPLSLGVPASNDERVSIEHQRLPESIGECIHKLREELGNFEHAEMHVGRLAQHYSPGASWAQGFARTLAELFARDGLVIIDPRDPALGGAAVAVHRKALVDAELLAKLLLERASVLEAAGYVVPVHVRERAPLSFFHPQGVSGSRYRLKMVEGGMKEIGGSEHVYELEELLTILEAEPLSFSTSALLRPILQDVLLPTAAYVGGPTEVAYFAQLSPLYAEYELPMPLVVPRARLRIIEEKTRRLLERLKVAPDDVARSEDDLLSKTRADFAAESGAIAQTLLSAFDAALVDVRKRIEASGCDLDNTITKVRGMVESAVAKLADKYEKARVHQDHLLIEDLKRLKWLLYPKGEPQERVYGLSYFAARYGEHAFIERVLEAVSPFDPSPKDLVL